jgi:hypothetical protein
MSPHKEDGMRALISGLAVVCSLALAGIPSAAAESTTMQGEIVDPAAYLKDGAHGQSALDQTYEAVDGGQTLAFLEGGTDTLYLLLAETPGEDPNELVYDYANQLVKITGTVHERGGLKGIIPVSIEPLQPEPAGAEEPESY